MARSAKLTSIDAVREMLVAFTVFGDEANAALDELDVNVGRAVEWITQDRKQYWETAVRRSHDRVNEARTELEKALTYRKVAGRTPSCREERAALEKAKRRAQIAEEINRSLPGWAHRIEHAVRELTGTKTLLIDWVHGELPRALAAMKQMSASLDMYAGTGQPARKSTPAAAASTAESETPGPATAESTQAGNKEQNDENMGSSLAGGQTPPGDEGSERGRLAD